MGNTFSKPAIALFTIANIQLSQFPVFQIQGARDLDLPVRLTDKGASIKNGFTPESSELLAGTAGTPGMATLNQGVLGL